MVKIKNFLNAPITWGSTLKLSGLLAAGIGLLIAILRLIKWVKAKDIFKPWYDELTKDELES